MSLWNPEKQPFRSSGAICLKDSDSLAKKYYMLKLKVINLCVFSSPNEHLSGHSPCFPGQAVSQWQLSLFGNSPKDKLFSPVPMQWKPVLVVVVGIHLWMCKAGDVCGEESYGWSLRKTGIWHVLPSLLVIPSLQMPDVTLWSLIQLARCPVGNL